MSDHESNSNSESGSGRRNRSSGDIEVRFLIPSKNAGSLIGKGGTIISRLRSEYPASIGIPDCPSPERIVTICGPESAVKKLIEEIVQMLDESSSSKGEADMRLLVHQSQAGCIIGKGGSKIKDLRSLCGGQVKVFGVACPQSTDRVVQVVGNIDRVLLTLVSVVDALKECPIKGVENNYNPFNCEEMFAHEYGGWSDPSKRGNFMTGPGGPMSPKDPWARGPMGGPPMSGPPPPIGGANRVPIGGPSHMGGGGMGGGFNERRSNRAPPPFSPPRNDNDYEDNKNFLNGSHSQSLMGTNSDNLTTTTQVTIPKDAAGAIIGKGGQRIRRIRHESCCAINIEDARPGSDDRIITITGSDQQIKHAQYLLQQSVREYGQPMGSGGHDSDRRY